MPNPNPVNPHRIEWMIEPEVVRGVFICTAESGAECRMTCPEGCESWGAGHEHELTDGGQCNAIDFFDNSGIPECYVGPDTRCIDGPIKIRWNGDWYEWEYAEEKSDPARESVAERAYRKSVGDLQRDIAHALVAEVYGSWEKGTQRAKWQANQDASIAARIAEKRIKVGFIRAEAWRAKAEGQEPYSDAPPPPPHDRGVGVFGGKA